MASPIRPALPAAGEKPLPPWPGSLVDVGDGCLHVRRAGDPAAPPAVFVHGLGGSAANWTDLMALLADRVDGHAPDLPGFGRSGPPRRGGYSLDTHARAIRDYVDRIDRGPVHLFGNSLGGAVAIRVAAEHPRLVRTLTLVAPALPQYRLRRTSDPRLGLLLLPGVAGVVNRGRQRRSAAELAAALMDLCVADPARLRAERLDELAAELDRRSALPWAAQALTASLRGLVASYLDPGPRNLWRQARSVTVPTLVVFGRHDRLVPVDIARRAGRVFPNAEIVVLDHVAHVPQIEDPALVASLVERHLEAHGGALRAAG